MTILKDTYCGLYCGACEVVNATTNEEKSRVIGLFESQIPGWHATLEEMHCSGCKSDDVFVNCAKCPIRSCAKVKGIDFCHQCIEYPCDIHKFMRSASKQIPILRHVKAMELNQEFIRTRGVEEWLADQEAKWRCPECGSSFSWYREECLDCKKDLKGIKDYEAL
jgi:hypothetical protein